jgi:hypothetical protein
VCFDSRVPGLSSPRARSQSLLCMPVTSSSCRWKEYESDETHVYKAVVSYKKLAQSFQHVDSWKKFHIVSHIVPKATPPDSNLLALASPPRTPSPMSSIQTKMVRYTSFTNIRTPPPLASIPLAVSTSSSVDASSFSSAVMASSTEVTNLYNAVCTDDIPHSLAGYFKDPDKDPDKDDYRGFFLVPDQPGLFKITEAFQLKGLISVDDSPAEKRNPIRSLSAKQRYSVAAAVAWSVLHLGENPLARRVLEREAGEPLPREEQAGRDAGFTKTLRLVHLLAHLSLPRKAPIVLLRRHDT